MRKKLRSSEGMTLTELLVSLGIVSLIGMVLTVGVNSAVKVYRDATRLYESETLCGTILTCLEDEFRFGRNIRTESIDGRKEVVYDSQIFGKGVRVTVDDDGRVLIGKDSDESFALLGDAAYTSGLVALKDDCEIKYDKDSGEVTITIAVGPDDTSKYVSHTVTVVSVDGKG